MLIDIFLLLLLFGMMFWCFTLGILRVLTMIIGMYLGLQIAALTYTFFAGLTADKTESSLFAHQVVWFGVLWLIWTIILTLLILQVTRTITLPKPLMNLDQIGGLFFGTLAALFVVLIVGLVFKQVVGIVALTSRGSNPLFVTLNEQFQTSLVIQVLVPVQTVYVNFLSPWLPANQIPVFKSL